jgi:hypothetical protein
MPDPRYYYGFKLHTGLRLVTVWTFDKKTNQLVSTSKRKPDSYLNREQRVAVVKEILTEYGMELPANLR